jgi:hypothetical protein
MFKILFLAKDKSRIFVKFLKIMQLNSQNQSRVYNKNQETMLDYVLTLAWSWFSVAFFL